MMNREVHDLKLERNGSSREHLLSSQNHSTVAQGYLKDSFGRWIGLHRFGTDRDEHDLDGGAERDRSVRRARLFRRTGRERFDGPDGVDMAQVELEGVDAKMFVLARTPLLASMGRWVILSNGKKAFNNSAKKSPKRVLTAMCTKRRRVRRRVANTPLSGIRAMCWPGRKACDDETGG
jgi:hypothetical protein